MLYACIRKKKVAKSARQIEIAKRRLKQVDLELTFKELTLKNTIWKINKQ